MFYVIHIHNIIWRAQTDRKQGQEEQITIQNVDSTYNAKASATLILVKSNKSEWFRFSAGKYFKSLLQLKGTG
jgi:hypothetical protein